MTESIPIPIWVLVLMSMTVGFVIGFVVGVIAVAGGDRR